MARLFRYYVVFTILVLLGSRPAWAGFVLRLDDLGTTGIDVVVEDNGAGDSDPAAGSIAYWSLFSGPVGAFNATITMGVSKPLLRNPSPYIAEIKVTEILLSAITLPRTLEVSLTDTDFTVIDRDADGFLDWTSTFAPGVTGSGVANAVSYLDLNNAEFGIPGTESISHPTYTAPGGFDSQTVKFAYAGESFSLTQVMQVTLNAPGDSFSGDMVTTVHNPEPSTWLIWSVIGGVFFGAERRRRRKAAARRAVS